MHRRLNVGPLLMKWRSRTAVVRSYPKEQDMQQVVPTVSSTDDAQRAGPIPLDAEALQKVAGGTGQPTPPSIIVVIDPVW